ncbi:alcohol dehydrogenase [Aurantiacibacter luteus]|uniref:Alcohol dehydrogenase n=2 Tax=Aurantiacibacter luteus TaxID=1581420 RepID=A0A0G9MXF8_9SPHN|nr:alcohol dehydrogenase [Aurantiacibacter luteus]
MRAFVLTGYGGPEKTELRDMVRPLLGAGEVLVRVHAAGLNPVDYKTRDGKLKLLLDYPMPAIMGNELAGTVEEVEDGVTAFAPGDRVFARVPKDAMGALAEYAALPADCCAPIPDGWGFERAAAVPLAGLTALQALRDELGLRPGQRVFISGGAGGVGTFAIQIAKWLGAEVITTASPRGCELVERMGADRVIDYTSEHFEDVLTEKVDGAFDLIGGDTLMRTFGVVKDGGKVVSIGGTPEPTTAEKDLGGDWKLKALFWAASLKQRAAARRHGVTYRYLFMHPSGAELAELAALMESGKLDPQIDRTFSLADTKEAFAYLEKGHAKGKVVIKIAD